MDAMGITNINLGQAEFHSVHLGWPPPSVIVDDKIVCFQSLKVIHSLQEIYIYIYIQVQ